MLDLSSSATIIPLVPTVPKHSSEADREQWQRQIAAKYSAQFFKIGIALSWYFNGRRGGEAWPGVQRLMDDTGASKSTVLRALKAFEDGGDLEVHRSRKPDGTQNVNHYFPIIRSMPGARAVTPGTTTTGCQNGPSRVSKTAPAGCQSYDTITSYEPPIIEPPIYTNIETNPIIQIKGVGEEGKAGTNLTSIAKPSMPNNPAAPIETGALETTGIDIHSEEYREMMRGKLASLRAALSRRR